MWSFPVHSLICLMTNKKKYSYTRIKFEVVMWLNVSIVVLWYVVLWQIPEYGRNLLPVCSFLHLIPLNDGGCKSTTQCGMLLQKAVYVLATRVFNKWMVIYSNMIIETSIISKYIFIHEIRSDLCNVLLHCGHNHRLWSNSAFWLYITSQDLPWLHHTAGLLHTKHVQSIL